MPSGLAGVRVLRPLHVPDVAAALRTPGQLRTPRWNPTVTLLPDGGLLVMGGTPGSDGAPEGEGSSLGTNQVRRMRYRVGEKSQVGAVGCGASVGETTSC